ncbi:MAG: hypothetical protein JW802_05300 [Campylobacterales bacterium]|nr:hypothetical protein [Campylobacterales bacterium]MBN2831980.1 hypothetical protein [Campylobacterales bacterium]
MPTHHLLTIQQYATKHKMSTFAVVKLINQKKLKVIKQKIENQEQEFIADETISSSLQNSEQKENVIPLEKNDKIDYEHEFHALLAKYIALQEKHTQLIEERIKA